MAASMVQKDTVTANDPTQGARGAKKFAQQTNGVKNSLSEFDGKSNPCSQFFLRTDKKRDVPGIVQEQLRGRNDEPHDEDAGGEGR